MKACLHCDKSIGDSATRCAFCGSEVESVAAAPVIDPTVSSIQSAVPPPADPPPAPAAAPELAPPPAAVMTATTPRPVAVDTSTAPWPGSPPTPGPAGTPSFRQPSRRTTTVIAVVVALALVAAGVVLLTGGDSTPPSSASGPLTAAEIAQDRAAQSDLRNALVAAKVMYTDSGSYAKADAGGLGTIEPKLCYVGAATASVAHGAKCVSGDASASVSVQASGQSWSAARFSASGTCFWIHDDTSVGTTYGSGLPCTGAAAVGASSSEFPGGAGAANEHAIPAGCVDFTKVSRLLEDARTNEQLAAKSLSISAKIQDLLDAAADMRSVAQEFKKYPRIAGAFRASVTKIEVTTDALAWTGFPGSASRQAGRCVDHRGFPRDQEAARFGLLGASGS